MFELKLTRGVRVVIVAVGIERDGHLNPTGRRLHSELQGGKQSGGVHDNARIQQRPYPEGVTAIPCWSRRSRTVASLVVEGIGTSRAAQAVSLSSRLPGQQIAAQDCTAHSHS